MFKRQKQFRNINFKLNSHANLILDGVIYDVYETKELEKQLELSK